MTGNQVTKTESIYYFCWKVIEISTIVSFVNISFCGWLFNDYYYMNETSCHHHHITTSSTAQAFPSLQRKQALNNNLIIILWLTRQCLDRIFMIRRKSIQTIIPNRFHQITLHWHLKRHENPLTKPNQTKPNQAKPEPSQTNPNQIRIKPNQTNPPQPKPKTIPGEPSLDQTISPRWQGGTMMMMMIHYLFPSFRSCSSQ